MTQLLFLHEKRVNSSLITKKALSSDTESKQVGSGARVESSWAIPSDCTRDRIGLMPSGSARVCLHLSPRWEFRCMATLGWSALAALSCLYHTIHSGLRVMPVIRDLDTIKFARFDYCLLRGLAAVYDRVSCSRTSSMMSSKGTQKARYSLYVNTESIICQPLLCLNHHPKNAHVHHIKHTATESYSIPDTTLHCLM